MLIWKNLTFYMICFLRTQRQGYIEVDRLIHVLKDCNLSNNLNNKFMIHKNQL